MPVRRYTHSQLLALRESTLVRKPDDLPPIEQWLEYVYLDKDSREKLRIPHSEPQGQQQQQQKQRGARLQDGRDPRQQQQQEAQSPMGNFSTSARPGMMGRTKTGDDVVLGPPKTAFASSRSTRTFGNGDATGDAVPGDELDGSSRGKTYGQQNRKSANMEEKDGRDNRDSWTAARERRRLEAETQKDNDDRFGTNRHNHNNRRDREPDGERRNGENQDSRWGRRDDKRQNGENGVRGGGWRDRERERERDGNNNRRGLAWDRNDRPEKDPEWFDTEEPLHEQEKQLGMNPAHTQEDFQKWKEMMKGNKADVETPIEAPTPVKENQATKRVAPLKLENFGDATGFSTFGLQSPAAASQATPNPTRSTAQTGKKTSRFATTFNKTDASSASVPAMEETPIQAHANAAAEAFSDDKAGFDRILQMLVKNQGASPQTEQPMAFGEPKSPPPATNGTRRKSRFFDSAPKSPEQVQSPHTASQPPFGNGSNVLMSGNLGGLDDLSKFGAALPEMPQHDLSKRTLPGSNVVSPDPTQQSSAIREPPGLHGRRSEMAMNEPPSRGSGTPEVNIQNLLAAQRAQRASAPDKNSQFLLGLLNSKPNPPVAQQARPENFWVGQPPETHAPQPRAPPPPGLIDDQLLRNGLHDMHRAEQPPMSGPEMPTRRTSQRIPQPPPGFDEHHAMYLQQQQQMQQRRNFGEPQSQPKQPPQPRRMSGHPGMPPQHMQQFPPNFPFMQSPPMQQQGPPPGISNARHMQDFVNMPNMFQQGQPPQQRDPPPGLQSMMPNMMSPPGLTGPPPGIMAMRSPPEGFRQQAGAGDFNGRPGFTGYEQRR